MRKITFILMALVIGFTSCSDDDNEDDLNTCQSYVDKYEKKFEAVDETDLEAVFELLAEYIGNIPEGCEDEIDID